MPKFIVETSARHVHVTQETLETSVYQLVTHKKCKMAVKTHALFYMLADG